MPIYGSLSPVTAVGPGDRCALFDGTETPATGLKSMAIARGHSPSMNDAGLTIMVYYAAGTPNATLIVQAANEDVEAEYQTLFTSTNNAQDNYTDTVRWAFYRVQLSAYVSGGMPKVIVQR